MDSKGMEKLHTLTVSELFGVIDHKVRGIQQLIIALREIVNDDSLVDSLNEVFNSTQQLQDIYKHFLKIRRIQMENVDITGFLKNELGLTDSKCSGTINVDPEKLKYIVEVIQESGGDDCTLSCNSENDEFAIELKANSFKNISIENLKKPPNNLSLVPFFVARRITEKMDGTLTLSEKGKLTISFSYS